jgi:putative flavoprotein involved in K+ transport
VLSNLVDTIVIGAGHAGLSISYYLNELGIDHIVFEKENIGSSWANQRWDSFRFNTPNKYNLLPGFDTMFEDEDGFCSSADFVSSLSHYSEFHKLPVLTHCEVISVDLSNRSDGFNVCIRENDSLKMFRSRIVVVASGGQNRKYLPAFSEKLSKNIFQIHACDYRNASGLPEGSVLVIGGAQSGVQITEDLMENGRKVFLSTSKVPRVPRRYRKKDIVEWMYLSGFFDMPVDPALLKSRFPHISGTGPGGHTVSLQSLARKGASLTGNAIDADSGKIYFHNDVISNIRFADESSIKAKQYIDEFLYRSGFDITEDEEDPDDLPFNSSSYTGSDSIDLVENHITSIIWTCGFTGDFSYLRLPVIDNSGLPKHNNGISDIKGLYFIGIPWLRSRKSGIVMGIKDDAEFILANLMSGIQ